MLDPDWTLPAQNWCRDNGTAGSGCYWRGELGIFWGGDCSPGGQWYEWFQGYSAMLVHYARLSQSLGVESFLISHELQAANVHCSELWYDILAAVRAVYNGSVSAAFEAPVLGGLDRVPWAGNQPGRDSLDYVGIDCYFSLDLPRAWNGTHHTELPWEDIPQANLTAAAQGLLPAFRNFNNASGKQIVCTEVGWMARPWTWS